MEIADVLAQLHEYWFRKGLVLPTPDVSVVPQLDALLGGFPDDFRELLRWSSNETWGQTVLGPGWKILSATEVISRLTALSGAHVPMESGDELVIAPDFWPADWVPIVEWNASVFGVLDVSHNSRVLGFDPQAGLVSQWAETLMDFFKWALSSLNSTGRVPIDTL